VNLEVKRAFVLADWMKAASECRDENEFMSLLRTEKWACLDKVDTNSGGFDVV
jgi:hypothetical protein